MVQYGRVGIVGAFAAMAGASLTLKQLSSELEMIVKRRNALEIKVKWQFTIENAREKLNRHYENVITKN